MKIGLLLIATGKYDRFVKPFLESVDKHFFKDDQVNVYLFTDRSGNKEDSKVSLVPDNTRLAVYSIPIKHTPFPYATLLRYKHFDENKSCIDADYLFYSDVDMMFVQDVGHEILGDIVATNHPGFWNGGWGSQNVDKRSMAYLPKHEWKGYCAGGFQGGKKEEYLKACNILNARIAEDERREVMAEWHDETHWNWFLKSTAKNVKKLSPSYCFPEAAWAKNLPFEKKLVALDKNHKEVRS